MNPILLITFLVVMAVMTAMIGFYRWLGWTRAVEERLADSFSTPDAAAHSSRALADQVNKRLKKLSFAERIERQLVAADSNMSVAEFLGMRAGLAIACFVGGWLFSGLLAGGILLSAVGWMAPAFQLRMTQARRAKLFASQLPDMLSMLVGSLRAGYGLLHAITVVEKEMPAPISTEFGRVVRETALGYSLGDALDHMVERVDNDDLALIVTAVHIQNEVGGSLAEVLETISKTIRERIQLKGEIAAMTAQQRITGSVLTGLPLILGTALTLLNPDYMTGMFQPGWPMLIPFGALIMVVLGNIMMRSITKIEV